MTDFSGTEYKHAPRSQHTNMSCTLKSKVISNICEKRSCSLTWYLSHTYWTYDFTFDWLTGTPLGSPVLPEVKSR